MRQSSINYFWGSLISRQSFFAYGIAAGFTTGLQLLMVTLDVFRLPSDFGQQIHWLVLMYLETLLPVWYGDLTTYNILMVLINLFFAVLILMWWTAKYDSSY